MPLFDPSFPNQFSILEVVLRLRDHCTVLDRNVGGGMEYDSSKHATADADKKVPYAFVIPIAITGGKVNQAEYYQSREALMGIVMCVDGVLHKTGATGNNPVKVVQSFAPLQTAIEDSLLRWKPVGFTLDTEPKAFVGFHPLGASETRAWAMLEFNIPFRHYHVGYGGGAAQNEEEFMDKWPDYRADHIEQLFIHYKASHEFSSTVGGYYYWDTVPLPIVNPTEEELTARQNVSEEFRIDDRVREVIEEIRDQSIGTIPQPGDVSFPDNTPNEP